MYSYFDINKLHTGSFVIGIGTGIFTSIGLVAGLVYIGSFGDSEYKKNNNKNNNKNIKKLMLKKTKSYNNKGWLSVQKIFYHKTDTKSFWKIKIRNIFSHRIN